MRRGPVQRALAVVGHRVLILSFTAFAIFPFYWMLITSFKQNSDLYVGASNTATCSLNSTATLLAGPPPSRYTPLASLSTVTWGDGTCACRTDAGTGTGSAQTFGWTVGNCPPKALWPALMFWVWLLSSHP